MITKDEVFLSWFNFAKWWVPVIIAVTLLLESEGGGGAPPGRRPGLRRRPDRQARPAGAPSATRSRSAAHRPPRTKGGGRPGRRVESLAIPRSPESAFPFSLMPAAQAARQGPTTRRRSVAMNHGS